MGETPRDLLADALELLMLQLCSKRAEFRQIVAPIQRVLDHM
jgi:hypothetical protein